MKIAVLCTSNDTSDFAKRHITDDVKYVNLLASLRPNWQYDCFAVWRNEFPEKIDTYQGIIITGSPASVNDKDDWIKKLLELIRDIYAKNVRMFGGCFGQQAIAIALGGAVDYNIKGGWSFGNEVTKFDSDAPYGLAGSEVTLYSVHKEEVTRLPVGARSIGSNAYCRYPAFVINGRVLTSQYHPEMTREFLVDLTYELEGKLDNEMLAKARAAFQSGHEGKRFAEALILFFESARGE